MMQIEGLPPPHCCLLRRSCYSICDCSDGSRAGGCLIQLHGWDAELWVLSAGTPLADMDSGTAAAVAAAAAAAELETLRESLGLSAVPAPPPQPPPPAEKACPKDILDSSKLQLNTMRHTRLALPVVPALSRQLPQPAEKAAVHGVCHVQPWIRSFAVATCTGAGADSWNPLSCWHRTDTDAVGSRAEQLPGAAAADPGPSSCSVNQMSTSSGTGSGAAGARQPGHGSRSGRGRPAQALRAKAAGGCARRSSPRGAVHNRYTQVHIKQMQWSWSELAAQAIASLCSVSIWTCPHPSSAARWCAHYENARHGLVCQS